MLAISSVLIQEPELLLLDEPSAGLAPALIPETLRIIRSYCDSNKSSAILVEQNVRQAVAVAHRVARLSGGLLHEGDGDPLSELRSIVTT